MFDIKWLDGKTSEGLFVLEIMFSDGGKGFMKGDYNHVSNHYTILWERNQWVANDVVGMTIYDPQWKVVANKVRAVMAEAC